MTFATMETRVLRAVQDPNGDIYKTAEVADAVNDAKDQVLSLVQIFTDQYPQTTLVVSFAAGDRVKPVTDCIKLLRVQSVPSSGTLSVAHRIWTYQSQDNVTHATDMWPEITAAGVYNLARRFTENAVDVSVIYVAKVADLAAAADTSFTFGPPPADNLIVVKSVITLLMSRNRIKGLPAWVRKETKLEQQLQENAQDIDDTGPRNVTDEGY